MKTRQARLLDDLVRKVFHVNLQRCRDAGEFRNSLSYMVRNLEEISSSLGFAAADHQFSNDQRINRAAENVKVKAERLLALCGAVPESFATKDEGEWRAAANNLSANYDILRFDAGHLYQLAVPESPFGVLRSAL